MANGQGKNRICKIGRYNKVRGSNSESTSCNSMDVVWLLLGPSYQISHHRIVACSTDLYGSLFQDHNRLFRLYSNNIRSSSTIVYSNTLCRHRSSGAMAHAESCWPSNGPHCPKVSGRSAGRGYCKVVSHWWCTQNVSKVWEWSSRAHFNTRKAWSTARCNAEYPRAIETRKEHEMVFLCRVWWMLICQKNGFFSNNYPEVFQHSYVPTYWHRNSQEVHYSLFLLAVRDRDDESQ